MPLLRNFGPRNLDPSNRFSTLVMLALVVAFSIGFSNSAQAQMGGMGGGGGAPGGGGGPGGPAEKPKFRDFIHDRGGIDVHREKGDALVAAVEIRGNRRVSDHRIEQELRTRPDRFYDHDTVLSDIHRLTDMGMFDHVTFETEKVQGGMKVTFLVTESPVITQVIYHGNQGINERELGGRAGITANDPLSVFSVESARRRLVDYYKEEGFNQATVDSTIGTDNSPGEVIFRINEGPKERISKMRILGSSIVSESRLKKIITSRGPFGGFFPYANNKADLSKIDKDVDVLAAYYHNLGFLTATVGRRLEYDRSGKWLSVTFVVNEGPRFRVNEIQILGNEFIQEESLRNRLELKSGDMYDGTLLRRDVGELTYGYGELGFIYAEVEPQTVMRDEENIVDLVYKISEGDRWRVGEIRVNIDGEPDLMRETTMLNLVDLREGSFINRRLLELNRNRLERSALLETNPQIADPPDIKVIPREDNRAAMRSSGGSNDY
ncbi:Outer membrane protein assembly factor BamA precursor [Rubripirellula obstinata]|uniref:Outer membrane protein assembly factor BamA n=1 Tax=Rubripirellula obstinata TaxID=406547 RepID=A0A5B1CFI1_9BACT|nr:POTRA domain-containing protein [Rubripirellula obstinata]KAA1258675.1 Outer membrane protein assembly factor BamA precursor [Rubripirellula obstinata]